MEDKNLENQIIKANEEVEKALKELAQTVTSNNLIYEYLFLVVDVMEIYEKYEEKLQEEEYEVALEYATRIICKIELEKSGILSFFGDFRRENRKRV